MAGQKEGLDGHQQICLEFAPGLGLVKPAFPKNFCLEHVGTHVDWFL